MTVPPEELRVGVGPFADAEVFLRSGQETLALARRLIGLTPSQRVLDVGCGCGRIALAVATYLSDDRAYTGFDADPTYVAWCEEHIQRRDPRFTFTHLDVGSDAYNPRGRIEVTEAGIPYADERFDAVPVSSAFTHMFEPGIEHYVAEIARVLRPGGGGLISALLMTPATREAMRRGTTLFQFEHQLGTSSWAMDAAQPAEAVSVAESWLRAILNGYGLQVERCEYGDWRERRSWSVQHDWLAVRRGGGRAA